MAVLVDTGVLLAAADTNDQDHQQCAQLLRSRQGELRVSAPVIPETAWQIERNLGPRSETAFLRLITTGRLDVIDLTVDDWSRCIALIETYEDLGLGVVDASIVAIAERLNITTIATLNHRDFAVVRPAHCDVFELIP
jgi:predicted nucleic acid-binding protein